MGGRKMIQKCDFSLGDAKIRVIMQSGFSNIDSQVTVSSHCHPDIELHYIEDGQSVFCFGERSVYVSSHTLILIPAKLYHSFDAPDVSPWGERAPRRLSFEISISKNKDGSPLYDKYTDLFEKVKEPFIYKGFVSEAVNVGKIRGVMQSEEEICKLRAELTLLFLKLCELLQTNDTLASGKTPASAEIDPSDEYTTLIKLLGYIENNYQQKITLAQTSKYIGLSERQIQRILQMRMGEGFSKILSRLRIENARELILQNKSLTLEEISHRCGYQSYVSFWGQFKKQLGVTPEEYKRQKT